MNGEGSSGGATPGSAGSGKPVSAAAERIRFITSEIQTMLRLLVAGDTLRPGVASAELIGVLLRYLVEADNLRLSGQLDTIPPGDAMWRDYRAALESLSQLVPKMEQQLQNDRRRLAQEQDRLLRASAWSAAAKLTR